MFGSFDKAIIILRLYATQHPEASKVVEEIIDIIQNANRDELEKFNHYYQAMMGDGISSLTEDEISDLPF